MSQHKNPDPDSERDDAADEALVRRAVRRSIIGLLLAGLVGVALFFSMRWEKGGDEVVVERPTALPEHQSRPPAAAVPQVRFTDITREAGIDFVHVNGARGDKLLPETMGGGVAFLDYDADGDQDLLLVNGTRWPDDPEKGTAPAVSRLYRNDGSGRFEDVSADVGLDIELYGTGVATGDYDNDGQVDIFVSAVGENRLLRNQGGRFEDVTEQAGVAGDAAAWSTSSAFFDYDNDGDLDLFVANYVKWSPEIDFEVDFRLTGIGRAYGPPTTFEGSHSYLYRNNGDGTFSDVSAQSGIQELNPATGAPMGKALGVAPVDFDGDGWIDLAVANDTVRNFLFRNRGNGTFEEQGTFSGIAFDRDGSASGAMGMDTGYYRNDDALGLAVGNFANEMTSLYVTQGDSLQFGDEAIVEGIGPATRQALTFGLFFFDYDLDGRLDLLQVNGHLEEDINLVQASQQYRQSAQLFWNCGDRCPATFVPVPTASTGDLGTPVVGRGVSYGDIDGDGDLDVVITQVAGSPLLLRNDQQLGNHWLRVKLVGTDSNRDAIGARVELVAGGQTLRRQVMPARSYLSQVELPVTFGLGDNASIESLRVTWPDGAIQEVEPPAVDSAIVVTQPVSASESADRG